MTPQIDERKQPTTYEIDGELVAFTSDYLVELTDKSHFSGVVLFARGEEVYFYRTYGLASREYNVANRTDTRFNLASASKMFTAVVIARLVEEGKLSFDDPIGRYLDTEWVSAEVGDKVRISHLLSHTSGLGHYWDEYDRYAHAILELSDYRPIIDDTLAFEPGTEWQYSNSGYILLGAIIEEVTGESYYECVQEMVFDPAGMTSTGFYKLNEINHNLATATSKMKTMVGS